MPQLLKILNPSISEDEILNSIYAFFESLPDGFSVGGSLYLPDGVSVGGDFLSVGVGGDLPDNLDLSNAESAGIPDNISVSGKVCK